MRGIFNLFRENLAKIYTNVVFYVAVLGTFLILAAGSIFQDYENGNTYSAISLLTSSHKSDIVAKGNLDYQGIIISGPNSYLWMFATVLVSLPFVVLMCSAKKNSNTRFELYRTSKWKYSIAKLTSVMIGGGSILALGYALYSLLVYFAVGTEFAGMRFQDGIYGGFLTEVYKLLGFNGYFILRILEVFIYGMYSVLIPFLFSGFSQNKYMVTCIPFMINYILSTVLMEGSLGADIFFLCPVSMEHICLGYEGYKQWYILGIVTISVLLCYRVVLGKRCDCGE